MQRFFVMFDALDGDLVRIVGDDAYHISRSLRMKKGEGISVCLPDLTQLDCELVDFSENAVTAKVYARSRCLAESPCRIRLFQALPKGDKMDIIVQKAVECGVSSITPFESSRCIAKAGSSFEKKRERWNRIALEAAKQSGRGRVPTVEPVLSYSAMLAEAASAELPLFCYEAEGTEPLGVLLARGGEDIAVVIGAEGGFSSEEATQAKAAGLLLTGLGKRILRCETASAFVLAGISLRRELS